VRAQLRVTGHDCQSGPKTCGLGLIVRRGRFAARLAFVVEGATLTSPSSLETACPQAGATGNLARKAASSSQVAREGGQDDH